MNEALKQTNARPITEVLNDLMQASFDKWFAETVIEIMGMEQKLSNPNGKSN